VAPKTQYLYILTISIVITNLNVTNDIKKQNLMSAQLKKMTVFKKQLKISMKNFNFE